ncbi:hypothetical protein [Chitinophaga sp. RAB17]|uniref:hypothetical protein n=1 Tax=Chitinophaga sp. RAB17 TaxID=3233049 RepID=UPI003F908384
MKQLKTTLLINAISSAAAGLLLIILASPFATLFGVATPTPFTGTGIFLLVFAGFVAYTATRPQLQAVLVKLVTWMDLSWVLASVVFVIESGSLITLTGSIIIMAIAAWVALMALLQYKGIKMFRETNHAL